MLAPMRYKQFTWPNNPQTYTVSFLRQTAVHKIPHGDYVVEDLGSGCRCIRGEGEFFGPDAYETFQKLAEVFQEGGPGMLFHPVWTTTSAYFTELKLKQEPRTDYVAYAFTFVEETSANGKMRRVEQAADAEEAEYYTAAAGDTLWSIGQRFSRSVRELLDWNPEIDNVNDVGAGRKVRVG